MSFEVEVKYRAVDHAALASRLTALGARAEATDTQEDVYFNHPSRDFAETHEAFRIRREGLANRITYKGPRHSGPTKTREEIEIAFTEGPDAAASLFQLLKNLGFRPVAQIRKARTPFRLQHAGHTVEIVLDQVEGLGTFAEVETLAATKEDLPAAQNAVLEVAGELGLTESEPRSYLRMVLEQTGVRR